MTRKECIDRLKRLKHSDESLLCLGNGRAENVETYSEAIKLLEKENNTTCWWQAPFDIMDNIEFKTSCRDNKGLSRGIVPNNFSFGSFRYCPWCGGEIEWVKKQEDFLQHAESENKG